MREIVYCLEPEDLLAVRALATSTVKKSWLGRLWIPVVFLGVFVGCLAISFAPDFDSMSFENLIVAAIATAFVLSFALAVCVLCYWLQERKSDGNSWGEQELESVRREFVDNPEMFADLSVTISKESITKQSSETCYSVRWPGISRVEIMPTHVFFFDTPLTAFVVPRRVFENPADFDEFVQAAVRFREAAIAAEKQPDTRIRAKDEERL
jgi:hypothetical protein